MSLLSGNRSRGKIDDLPEHLKTAIHEKMIKGVTYKAISDFLYEEGYEISYVSVHRHGKKYLKAFEGLKLAREFAKIVAEDNIDRPPTELHEAQIQNERLKIESRKAAGVIHTAMNEMREKIYAEMADKYPQMAETAIRITEEIEVRAKES